MILTIERLGHLGDGIGHLPDGNPVYMPQTLPGEVIEGELRNDALQSPRIVTPSPDRVRPPCPHYRTCGGCSLQHARDDFVAGWKQDVVRAALAAQGLEAEFRAVLTSLSHPYWDHHYTLTSQPQSQRMALLGATRITDILANVIYPWLIPEREMLWNSYCRKTGWCSLRN